MSTPETREVESEVVRCDGGGGALGHPAVYLTLGADGRVDCPYCGISYRLKEGVAPAAH